MLRFFFQKNQQKNTTLWHSNIVWIRFSLLVDLLFGLPSLVSLNNLIALLNSQRWNNNSTFDSYLYRKDALEPLFKPFAIAKRARTKAVIHFYSSFTCYSMPMRRKFNLIEMELCSAYFSICQLHFDGVTISSTLLLFLSIRLSGSHLQDYLLDFFLYTFTSCVIFGVQYRQVTDTLHCGVVLKWRTKYWIMNETLKVTFAQWTCNVTRLTVIRKLF